MSVYSQYTKDRNAWLMGMSGPQLGMVVASALPIFIALHRTAWVAVGLLLAAWVLIVVLTVVPVWGRPAFGWLVASASFTLASALGWNRFTSRAATGQGDPDPGVPDLPGVLHNVQVHDGPPAGPALSRPAIIQHHAHRTWAMSAAVIHPGLGFAPPAVRDGYGQGLSDLLEAASRTELIDELHFTIRVSPEDGAERDQYLSTHLHDQVPPLVRQVTSDLHAATKSLSVRTETYATFVVPEQRIARHARHGGRDGLGARAQVLLEQAREVEAHLLGGMGAQHVAWLTSPELAAVVRTGFAPEDRAALVTAEAERTHDPTVCATIPWQLAGPSVAMPAIRHYTHDAWHSVSATIALPGRGVLMGALAPMLTPALEGERRSFTVCYPVLTQRVADRQVGKATMVAEVTSGVRARFGVKERAKHHQDAQAADAQDHRLTQGATLTRPYAVLTVTVPNTHSPGETGRAMDASIRRAGFAPLRLDLAQDLGFAAGVLPLGVGLTRRTSGGH